MRSNEAKLGCITQKESPLCDTCVKSGLAVLLTDVTYTETKSHRGPIYKIKISNEKKEFLNELYMLPCIFKFSFLKHFYNLDSTQNFSLIVKTIFPLRNCKLLNKLYKIGQRNHSCSYYIFLGIPSLFHLLTHFYIFVVYMSTVFIQYEVICIFHVFLYIFKSTYFND